MFSLIRLTHLTRFPSPTQILLILALLGFNHTHSTTQNSYTHGNDHISAATDISYTIGDPPHFNALKFSNLQQDPPWEGTPLDCHLEVTPISGLRFIALDCGARTVTWFTDRSAEVGKYSISVTEVTTLEREVSLFYLNVLPKSTALEDSTQLTCSRSQVSLSIVVPRPRLPDQLFDTSALMGSMTYEPFKLIGDLKNLCSQDDLVLSIDIDKILPEWLNITLDPSTSTVSWSVTNNAL
jgi:hypothetical protein